ncbi:DUF5677 domain-containing protein [Sphingomonas sp.]|uniref:DUF5677 domain-containing protein n=1 Tax=Sphingomonas sp. TaxID=28214 RepID=UPI0025D8F3AB|nr:DUF5677 domain-containing protein [Sphingomonas sp.]
MKISAEALHKCEPLFGVYVGSMTSVVAFQRRLFGSGMLPKDLTSETLRVLSSYQIDRSQGTYCLLVNGLVWDAEIVLRTVYETFAKVTLIASSSAAERDQLVHEYWNELSDIYDRKAASKAAAAQRLATDYDPKSVRVFAALQDPKSFNLEVKANKLARSRIEQRWSFSGILHRLSRDDSKMAPIGPDALSHIYGMASHVAHASSRALELMQDRQLRGSDLVDLEVGHVCRMLSDAVSLLCFGLYWVDRCFMGANEMHEDLRTAFDQIHAATAPHQDAFDRSQDELYDGQK